MNSVGDIRQVAAYDGREVPPPQPLIDLLRDGFRADAATGAIIASAIAYDVRTIPPGTRTKVDAVAVQLDHRGPAPLRWTGLSLRSLVFS